MCQKASDVISKLHRQLVDAQWKIHERNPNTSYPAKATPEIVATVQRLGYSEKYSLLIAEAVLAAAPPDDRDARISELEAKIVAWEKSTSMSALKTLEAERDSAVSDRNDHYEKLEQAEQERDELLQQLDSILNTDEAYREGHILLNDVCRAVAKVRARRASKAAHGFTDALRSLAEQDEPLPELDAAPVDKTKLPGYGECSICEYFDTPHNEPPCESCIHAVGAAIDNWTPKEGVK